MQPDALITVRIRCRAMVADSHYRLRIRPPKGVLPLDTEPAGAFADALAAFLDASPTPFHAVSNLVSELEAAGYVALDEGAPWTLEPGGRYHVVRNQGSVIAFRLPADGTAQRRTDDEGKDEKSAEGQHPHTV